MLESLESDFSVQKWLWAHLCEAVTPCINGKPTSEDDRLTKYEPHKAHIKAADFAFLVKYGVFF